MAEWIRDILTLQPQRAFSETTARLYKRIWVEVGLRHGADPKSLPSFRDAQDQVRGRSEPERRAGTNFRSAIEHGSVEQKREAFARLAQDPEVMSDSATTSQVFSEIAQKAPEAVQQAWQDTETNVALSRARWEARDEALEPQREAVRETRGIFEPKDATLDRRVFLADVATKVEQWTRELNGIREFLEFSDDVDRIRRWSTRQALDRLVTAATECRDALPSSYEEQTGTEAPSTGRQRRKLAAS